RAEPAVRATPSPPHRGRVRDFQYNRHSLGMRGGGPNEPSSARGRRGVYHALPVRDMAVLANFLHHDVVCTVRGPVAIPPFFGQRVGKALVMKLLGRDSPTLWSSRCFLAKTMLVDGDRASVLGRLTATKRASGQAISYRIAQFIQFRDKKVVDFVSIIDSFHAVQQLLGYNLDADDGYWVEGNVVMV